VFETVRYAEDSIFDGLSYKPVETSRGRRETFACI